VGEKNQMEIELTQLFDALPGLTWTALPNGQVDSLNQHWVQYTGLHPDEFRGHGWQTAIHPEDLPGLLERWQFMLATGQPCEAEARLRRFDGEYRWFLLRTSPLTDASGQILKWCAIYTDIQDLRLPESDAALRRSEARNAAILDSALDCIVTIDHHGCITEFNPAAERTFGYRREQVLGRHLADVIIPPPMREQHRRGLARYLATGESRVLGQRLELTAMRADETEFPVELAITRIPLDGPPSFTGYLRDITERKQAEDALCKARSELARVARVTTLGALAASIAHEVNQPLSGIITNAGTCLRMLAADPPNLDGARETARRTIRDGNRASEVITRLRALFSKKEAAIESVDLNEAAQEVLALSRSELQRNQIILRTELADDLPPVMGDRVQLQQVILNLLLNASEAMTGIDDRPRQLVIRTEPDQADHVRLSVQDSGVGFGPQGPDKLFEAFYTTKTTGMGIGLSVSRSIIESHHGHIWAAPNDGPGATFTFSIPCKSDLKPSLQTFTAARAPQSLAGAGQATRSF
jgi:PAS domain S-box-containing protein